MLSNMQAWILRKLLDGWDLDAGWSQDGNVASPRLRSPEPDGASIGGIHLLVESLIESKYVAPLPDPNNAYRRQLAITPRGNDAVAEWEAAQPRFWRQRAWLRDKFDRYVQWAEGRALEIIFGTMLVVVFLLLARAIMTLLWVDEIRGDHPELRIEQITVGLPEVQLFAESYYAEPLAEGWRALDYDFRTWEHEGRVWITYSRRQLDQMQLAHGLHHPIHLSPSGILKLITEGSSNE